MYLYQELVQTFSFRKKSIFASFERVCLQTLARFGIGKADPAVRKVKNMKKVSLDELSQVKLYPDRLRFTHIFPTLCAFVRPSACPAERMLGNSGSMFMITKQG